jgi:hypothetical protein
MQFLPALCQLALFSKLAICTELINGLTTIITTTPSTATATSAPTTTSTLGNPLAPARLESIKDSYSELNLLSKTNPSDFIFDFGNATTGISTGTGGHSVAATVSISTSTLF